MEKVMQVSERVFYASENGDQWLLSDSSGTLAVRHQPNAASGGTSRTFELSAFLANEQHSAQNQALRKLIATLVSTPVIDNEDQVVKIYDHNSTE
jgi:hypothetical protein